MRLVALPLVLLATATAVAQSPSFASPVRLKAGDAFLGQGRLFPSPVYHDLDGDRRADLVVGDLRGHLTVASRGEGATFGKEEKVLGADGKILDLQNW
jgi:hypothetical protein